MFRTIIETQICFTTGEAKQTMYILKIYLHICTNHGGVTQRTQAKLINHMYNTQRSKAYKHRVYIYNMFCSSNYLLSVWHKIQNGKFVHSIQPLHFISVCKLQYALPTRNQKNVKKCENLGIVAYLDRYILQFEYQQ